MDDRHWRFLATVPYAAFLLFVLAALGLPSSVRSGAMLAAVTVGGGVLAAAAFAYGGGYERLDREGPGRNDLVELLVVIPMAALVGIAVQRLVPGGLPEPWYPIVPVLIGLFLGQFLFNRLVEPRLAAGAS